MHLTVAETAKGTTHWSFESLSTIHVGVNIFSQGRTHFQDVSVGRAKIAIQFADGG